MSDIQAAINALGSCIMSYDAVVVILDYETQLLAVKSQSIFPNRVSQVLEKSRSLRKRFENSSKQICRPSVDFNDLIYNIGALSGEIEATGAVIKIRKIALNEAFNVAKDKTEEIVGGAADGLKKVGDGLTFLLKYWPYILLIIGGYLFYTKVIKA